MGTLIAESSIRDAVTDSSRRSTAVVFRGAGVVDFSPVDLVEPGGDDVLVDVHWSGVSTGTERLLWSSDMPPFPGLSYPLVPGYEAVGVAKTGHRAGESVFVPGSHSFKNIAGVFGASASQLVAPAEKLVWLGHDPCPEDTLIALAATARHAISICGAPDLIIGHGVLGRLVARISIALGNTPPTVWETNASRRGETAYPVLDPATDERRDYARICDVSGDSDIIDKAVAHAAKGANITLAGFYSSRPSFAFPPAFMKEITLRIAAEWTPEDLAEITRLREAGALSFAGLITHTRPAEDAASAYDLAFGSSDCLKMALDWRSFHDHAH